MLKNYFIVAIKNLLKNRLISLINIIGLAVGLAACIIITLYVIDQTSYDKQWENSDRIYRINWQTSRPGNPISKDTLTPLPAMPAIKQLFHDKIEYCTRILTKEVVFEIENLHFVDQFGFVDSDFLDIFQIEELAGSLRDTLKEPFNIALSVERSKKYFGDKYPIGKAITVKIADMTFPCKVTAVYRIPGNSIIDIPILSPLPDALMPASIRGWNLRTVEAYFLLKEGINIEALKPFTPAFIDKYMISYFPNLKSSEVEFIEFQKLEEAHLNSPWDTARAGGNKTVVSFFAAIAFLILLIGCINFTILTTTKAAQRAKEVAMRKVAGAKRKQLIIQFLGESIFIVLLAMILSFGLFEMILPLFRSIVGITLSIDYTSPSTILLLLVLLFFIGISGGIYPAFILSSLRPGNSLKANQSRETHGAISLRNVLVIFQFSVSIALIIATIVIYAQLQFSFNRDPGYNKDNLLIINQLKQDISPEIRAKLEPLKQELLKLSNVSDVSFSNLQPSHQKSNNYVFERADQPEITHVFPWMKIGYDFFKTYQIPVIAGRNYSLGRDNPEPLFDFWTGELASSTGNFFERNIMVNEKAVERMGYTNAEESLGEIITLVHVSGMRVRFTIIGVVADNHMYSINTPPRAEVYTLDPVQVDAITLRFNGSPKRILEQVKSVWSKVISGMQIHTAFVNQLVEQEYKQEQMQVKIIMGFSLLAIIIACMGLFGTTSYVVERRTREIGLRKVMGARVKNIVRLFLWQFSKPIVIANIIAWPVAILAMQNWLERFPYHINPLFMIPICLGSGLIALVIALFTVAGNTVRVARSRPIHSLRYE